MFVVVAIGTEVLPVAAVGRIVGVVAVLVVDGQQVEVVLLELAAALGADPAVQLERAGTVVIGRVGLPAHRADQGIDLFLAFLRRCFRPARAKRSTQDSLRNNFV